MRKYYITIEKTYIIHTFLLQNLSIKLEIENSSKGHAFNLRTPLS